MKFDICDTERFVCTKKMIQMILNRYNDTNDLKESLDWFIFDLVREFKTEEYAELRVRVKDLKDQFMLGELTEVQVLETLSNIRGYRLCLPRQ